MNNIISFHGSDHKNGVTMLAQSVSEEICRRYPERSVLFIGMNQRSSCDYVREGTCSIEDLKKHIDNFTLSGQEIKMLTRCRKNLHVLGGIRSIIQERMFFPETADYLFSTIKPYFDLIICDTGSDLDNGLALGALTDSDLRYCIISQSESSLESYESHAWLFRRLKIDFQGIIINKYFARDPYDIDYIAKRIGKSTDEMMTVRMAGYARQAEMDHRTLLEYRSDGYGNDIADLAGEITRYAGFEERPEKRRRLWKTGSI